MAKPTLSRKKITNLQMQKIADQNEANCPIDKKGNLQAKVNKDTAYIVDANAKMKGKKMKVLMDREGNYFYFIEVKRWW